jgi:alkylation response protein AidB-like acyl-CoA dehydrogenase
LRSNTPPGWKEAYTSWAAAGWNGLASPAAWGGQELPHALNAACVEMWNSASMAFGIGPVLTMAAMFTMMNRARLAVALQGVAIAERATQQAMAYARDRKQTGHAIIDAEPAVWRAGAVLQPAKPPQGRAQARDDNPARTATAWQGFLLLARHAGLIENDRRHNMIY